MPRFESGFLFVGSVFLLIAVVLAVCLVRRLRIPPQPFWVLTLSCCIASIPLAIQGCDQEIGICFALALVAFAIGFIASIRKE